MIIIFIIKSESREFNSWIALSTDHKYIITVENTGCTLHSLHKRVELGFVSMGNKLFLQQEGYNITK